MRWLSGYNTCNASPETQVQPPEPCKGEKTGLTLQSCLTWTYSYSVRVPIHTIIRKKEVCKEEGREEKREEEEKWGGILETDPCVLQQQSGNALKGRVK